MTRPFPIPQAKRPKFGNRRTTVAGVTYDSAKEARRAMELALLERAKVISGLERQVTYSLDVNGVHVTDYRCDFRYTENGQLVVEDVKGFLTPEYKIKRALMLAVHGITIREV